MLIIDTVSTCFGHLYARLQEKDTCYCMWCVFSVTRNDADISRVVFYGDSVWFDKLGLLVCVCVCVAVSGWVCRSIVSRFVRLVRSGV